MEVNNIVMAKSDELDKKWAKIFSILGNEKESEALLLLIIVNKALEEVCGRRINKDDFFHPEQLLNALNLIEQWLKTDSYFLERVH
tara:strand:+ start:2340 stop:2597 length:258 start_codon:yes stop_codon:yes gene_type:complete